MPLTITKTGRDRLVIPSAQECDRLRHRDRRMLQAGELTNEEAAVVAKAEVPTALAHVDDNLKDQDACTVILTG
jgi:hypothetical protein